MESEIERLQRTIASQQKIIERQAAELSRVDELIKNVFQTIDEFRKDRLEKEKRFTP